MKYKKLTDDELGDILNELINKSRSVCRECKEEIKVSNKKDGEVVYCSNKLCVNGKKYVSQWKNTIFYKCKISKLNCLKILELWINKFTNNQIEFLLGISRQTIYRFLKVVTEILIPAYYNNTKKIGEEEDICEIDESKFGKRKYNRGHPVEGVWVLGMVTRGDKRKVKLFQVEKRDKDTLSTVIDREINKEAILFTDCWKGYNDLEKIGFVHEKVNHSKWFVDESSGVHTNSIEGTWSGVKRNIPYRARTKDLINPYLVRYMLTVNEDGNPLINLLKYLF